ncbi:MAG: pyridoxal phosphate-dependent aminotransferase [Oscillospiraceae bacterium]|nr:pyridoxal phosphate-dependent aminotransferase [Oscillospiraceae bacterium]
MSYISKLAKEISPSPTLAIDAKFKEMQAQGIPVIGFGTGEPDFNTPDNIIASAIDALHTGVTKYTPASGTLALKKAICEKLKRDNNIDYAPNQIVVSNGAKHSLTNIFMAICDEGDEVIIPAPYWVSYPEMVKLAGGKSVIMPTTEADGFKFKPADIEKYITKRTRAIVLNSPSNPTGMIYNRAELEQIAQIAVKHNIYVISDEVYEKLVYEGEHVSIASLGDEIKALTILVNGVSKTYAMTGWRIGYTASTAALASAMGNIQSHATSNPNSIAQAASVEALGGDQTIIDTMKAEYLKRRNYMVEKINSIDGVSCITPNGAFYVMMNVSKLLGREHYGKMINTAEELCENILEKANVALVSCEGFGIDGYARLSYATSMENIQNGLDRIEKYIKGEC